MDVPVAEQLAEQLMIQDLEKIENFKKILEMLECDSKY